MISFLFFFLLTYEKHGRLAWRPTGRTGRPEDGRDRHAVAYCAQGRLRPRGKSHGRVSLELA